MANGVLGAEFAADSVLARGPKGDAQAAKTNRGKPRLARRKGPKNDSTQTPATQPSVKSVKGDTPTVDARRERIKEMREAEAEKVREEIAKLPALPSPDQMVVPSKLFADLGKDPTPAQLVDAAVVRFVQQPLAADKENDA